MQEALWPIQLEHIAILRAHAPSSVVKPSEVADQIETVTQDVGEPYQEKCLRSVSRQTP